MCALRTHIKFSIFKNIFSKIEKTVITFSIFKKIFPKTFQWLVGLSSAFALFNGITRSCLTSKSTYRYLTLRCYMWRNLVACFKQKWWLIAATSTGEFPCHFFVRTATRLSVRIYIYITFLSVQPTRLSVRIYIYILSQRY